MTPDAKNRYIEKIPAILCDGGYFVLMVELSGIEPLTS
jgi:hypothetical protein